MSRDDNLIGSGKDERPRAISCFAWNKDGTMLALSPNNQEVWLYETKSKDPKDWTRLYVLDEHSGFVSGIDWSHAHNQLATCGHDRNAYVWRYDDKKDEWRPTLVLLHIDRAATSVKWSPCGKKFAVSSGAKSVPICYFEQKNDWWVSKVIKKHKSTVLSVAWSPNSAFVVTGCCDRKVRVCSTFIAGVDSADGDALTALFPNAKKFGEVLAEFDQGKAWVHSVAWSPSGTFIAFASHASVLGVATLAEGGAHTVQELRLKGLPFLEVAFLSDKALVGVGWDNKPALFVNGGSWAFQEYLDKEEARAANVSSSAFGAAKAKFAAQVQLGMDTTDEKTGAETVLKTKHQNTITGVRPFPTNHALVTTCGVDGRVLMWDLAAIGVDVKKLGL